MNINDAIQNIRAVFPNATIEKDNYGQVVVYTDMQVQGDALVPFVLEA